MSSDGALDEDGGGVKPSSTVEIIQRVRKMQSESDPDVCAVNIASESQSPIEIVSSGNSSPPVVESHTDIPVHVDTEEPQSHM